MLRDVPHSLPSEDTAPPAPAAGETQTLPPASAPGDETRLAHLLSLWQAQHEQGRDTPAAELCRECPELAPALAERISALRQVDRLAGAVQRSRQTATVAPTAGAAAPLSAAAIPGYEVLGELGRGGMGVVYQARHLGLGRVVALKMILCGGHASPDDQARFLAEGQAVAQLQHANIVQLFESGTHQGQPFFTLEFVPGGSLAHKLGGVPLQPAEAARLVEQLARGVQYAHERGIVHRDLKPHNVLLAEDGTPKVTDFGLAKRVQDEPGEPGSGGLTATGAILGTPSYMAPEQASGQGKQVGPPADVYALGAILYECLTGRPPFQGPTPLDTVLQVVKQEPVPPTQLQPKTPRDLETICLKCLQKEPGKRYASAADLGEDLRRFQAGEPIAARRVRAPERLLRWCRRNPVGAALAAVAVAGVLSVLVLSVVIAVGSREAARRDRDRLFESLVSQAHAERRTGDRQRALELLAEAARMQPTDRVRQEAIQTITTSGVRSLGELLPGEGRQRERGVFSPIFSSDDNLVAFTATEAQGPIAGRRRPDGAVEGGANAQAVLHVHELRSGKLLAKRTDLITPLRFRPTTSHLAIAKGFDSPVTHLWDPVSGKDLGTYQGTNPVFSADGAYLATVAGKQARIWNLAQGTEAKSPDRGSPLLFLSGRELLLHDDGRYRRWDFTLGRVAFVTPKSLRALAIGANGRLAALHGRPVGQAREAILVWDLIEGKQVSILPDVGFVPSSASFSSDGKLLALEDSSRKRMTILVWDLATRSLISRLSARGVQASQGTWAKIHSWGYPAASFSADGCLLVGRGVRGGRYVLCLWDVETGEEITALPQITYFWWKDRDQSLLTLGARSGDTDAFYGTATPEGVSVWQDGTPSPILPSGHLNHWRVTHPTPTYLLDSHIRSASFSQDGSRLAVNDTVWEVTKRPDGYSLRRSGIPTGGLLPVLRGRDEVWALDFSRRAGAYATIYRLGPRRRKIVLPRPAFPEIDKQIAEGRLYGLQSPDFSPSVVAFSPDGKVALLGSSWWLAGKKGSSLLNACPLELWDISAGRLVKRWNKETYAAPTNPQGEDWKCVQFSPDGKRAITSSRTGLKVWDVARGEIERNLTEIKAYGPASSRSSRDYFVVDQVAFSQDGKRVLAVSSQYQGGSYTTTNGKITNDTRTRGRAVVFAVKTGEELRSWEAPWEQGGWKASTLSPDGRLVASWGNDRLIRLWDVTTGQELAHWEGHEADVSTLLFHPDGQTLLSGSQDGTLKLWNLPMIRKGLASLGLDWQ